MYGNVGNNIHGDAILFLEEVETMNLCDFLVLCQCLHNHVLQLCPAVFTCGNSIYPNRHENAVTLIHQFGNPSCKTVNLMGIQSVIL